MRFNILVVDYDSIIREQVSSQLGINHEIIQSDSAERALVLFQSLRIDLILTELALPQKSGLDFLKEIRSQSSIPIIVLSNRGTSEDQIQAFESGADDYITKPCDLKVLNYKLSRILEWSYPHGVKEKNILIFKTLCVNKQSRIVQIDKKNVAFRPKEFELLAFLMENMDSVLNRDQILDRIWGVDYFGDSRVVDTHIKKIRKKIGSYARQISTVFGVGYKFEGSVKG